MTILRLTWIFTVMLGVFVAGSRTPAQPSAKPAVARTAVSQTAVTNRAPLQQGAFALLPLGAIEPRGWLQTQLRIQADGLGGHLDEFWPDVGPNSAWLGGNGEGWERGPYFLDGLLPLAYQLNDPRLIAKTKPWIEWTLTHQRPDGAIGPPKNTDWWPNMIMLKVLTQYHEATADPRVIPFMTRYFAHHAAELDARPLKEWAIYRWHDELVSVLWLYNRTGDEKLLDFARRLQKQGFDWRQQFADFKYTEKVTKADAKLNTHVVNNAMALKHSGVWWLVTGADDDKQAVTRQFEVMDRYHLLPSGVHSGDEHYAGRNPSQGTELCAVVEGMFSIEQLVAILGDPALGDRLEKIAFNALPAAFDEKMWAHQYDQQPNQVTCSLRPRQWSSNGPESNIFGLEPHFGCCTSNFHQGWPKLVSSLWMATPDGGLAAIAYAPNDVNTTVRGGVGVKIEERTHYPFDEGVQFIVSPARETAFPLQLRIPAWARGNVDIVINGVKQTYEANARPSPGSFFRLERTWKPGDKVEVTFEMLVRGSRWFNDSAVIERGPIVYALDIGEDWQKRTAGMKNPARPPAVDWEVHPTTPWNYALVINPDHLMTSGQVLMGQPRGWERAAKAGAWPSPFTRDANWTTLHVGARRVESWQMVDGSADAPPRSPVATSGPIENVRLIPYGMAKLRISAFPTTRP
jgi:hypothetical protein